MANQSFLKGVLNFEYFARLGAVVLLEGRLYSGVLTVNNPAVADGGVQSDIRSGMYGIVRNE
jgi:hypothetical protein